MVISGFRKPTEQQSKHYSSFDALKNIVIKNLLHGVYAVHTELIPEFLEPSTHGEATWQPEM